MELDQKKIQRIKKAMGLTWEDIARRGGLTKRQTAFEKYKSKSILQAEFFGKVFGMDAKEFIK